MPYGVEGQLALGRLRESRNREDSAALSQALMGGIGAFQSERQRAEDLAYRRAMAELQQGYLGLAQQKFGYQQGTDEQGRADRLILGAAGTGAATPPTDDPLLAAAAGGTRAEALRRRNAEQSKAALERRAGGQKQEITAVQLEAAKKALEDAGLPFPERVRRAGAMAEAEHGAKLAGLPLMERIFGKPAAGVQTLRAKIDALVRAGIDPKIAAQMAAAPSTMPGKGGSKFREEIGDLAQRGVGTYLDEGVPDMRKYVREATEALRLLYGDEPGYPAADMTEKGGSRVPPAPPASTQTMRSPPQEQPPLAPGGQPPQPASPYWSAGTAASPASLLGGPGLAGEPFSNARIPSEPTTTPPSDPAWGIRTEADRLNLPPEQMIGLWRRVAGSAGRLPVGEQEQRYLLYDYTERPSAEKEAILVKAGILAPIGER